MKAAGQGEGDVGRSVPSPAADVLDAVTMAFSGYTTEYLLEAMHAEHERAPESWFESALADYLTCWRGVHDA